MVQPIHSREQLEKFSISKLWTECDRLSIPRRRSKTDCITDILATQPQLVAQAELEVEDDDYLFHDEQPANLPTVGDAHFIGGFLLRCAEVGGDYAVVWNVHDESDVVMGEVRMGWDCFWTHTMSFFTFATPQEAVIDLHESLEARVHQPESDEAIAFEKIGDGKASSVVNGVLVEIVSVPGGYKTNLTGDMLLTDYGPAIKERMQLLKRCEL